MKFMVAITCLFFLGCHCPEKAILRESMDQGTRSIRKEHKNWSQALKIDPLTGTNKADQLPALSESEYDSRIKTHEEYESLVQEDRNRQPR